MMTRLNITVPDELAKELGPIKNKSRFISEAIRVQFEIQKRKLLTAKMMEGYKAGAVEDKKISQAWEATLADGLDD